MYELLPVLESWLPDQLAMATVVGTWGSSPRPVGSVLLVRANGEMAGSVSGGCVENAVVKAALQILPTRTPRLLHFGISNDEAWAVGLSCGGKLDVLIAPFPTGSCAEQLLEALRTNTGGVILTRTDTTDAMQQLFLPASLCSEHPIAATAWGAQKSQLVETSQGRWFIHIIPRKKRLLIVGAAHLAAELVRLAQWFDFETIVIDPRQVFMEKTYFSEAPSQLLRAWPAEVFDTLKPDPYTSAVLLSHDPKIDDQALHFLLRSEVGYIGALGSRRTHESRISRLREAGYIEAEIARIHAPIGLPIGAQGAREIALSIVAEIIQHFNTRS